MLDDEIWSIRKQIGEVEKFLKTADKRTRKASEAKAQLASLETQLRTLKKCVNCGRYCKTTKFCSRFKHETSPDYWRCYDFISVEKSDAIMARNIQKLFSDDII